MKWKILVGTIFCSLTLAGMVILVEDTPRLFKKNELKAQMQLALLEESPNKAYQHLVDLKEKAASNLKLLRKSGEYLPELFEYSQDLFWALAPLQEQWESRVTCDDFLSEHHWLDRAFSLEDSPLVYRQAFYVYRKTCE